MREAFEIKRFGKIMQKKIMEEQRKFYDVWMFESNEDIQNLALAFGERYFLSHALQAFEDCQHPGAKTLLGKILRLYMIDYLNEELVFYLTNDLMSKAFAQKIQVEFTQAVRDLVPHINDCVESFGLHKVKECYPPMARDWVKFNE